MNTRLQVEHPVTELVTGVDLVREQIRIAAGEKLLLTQEDIQWTGHAVECRVYAEDPEKNFLPSPGKITKLRVPSGPGVRDDSGVYEGWEVPLFYDPMISKLASYGASREEAINRMQRALREYHVGGIKTTILFFQDVLDDDEFRHGAIDTGFIARYFERRALPKVNSDVAELSAAEIAAAMVAATEYRRQVQQPSAHVQPASSKWKSVGRLTSFTNR